MLVVLVVLVAKMYPLPEKIFFMQPITNENGIRYYDKLPGTARLAGINDFFDGTGWKFGKYYLLESHDGRRFFIRRLHRLNNKDTLKMFIGAGRVYVARNDNC